MMSLLTASLRGRSAAVIAQLSPRHRLTRALQQNGDSDKETRRGRQSLLAKELSASGERSTRIARQSARGSVPNSIRSSASVNHDKSDRGWQQRRHLGYVRAVLAAIWPVCSRTSCKGAALASPKSAAQTSQRLQCTASLFDSSGNLQSWFVGGISRTEADALLPRSGMFLVRYSEKFPV